MVNHEVKTQYKTSLSDIMAAAQGIADLPKVNVNTTYLLFSGGAIRAVDGRTNGFVHGREYRMHGDILCESNTLLPLSKVLSFCYFVDQYAPTSMRAYYFVYDNDVQAIRIMFDYHGMCDYIWKLKPLSEMNSSYVY